MPRTILHVHVEDTAEKRQKSLPRVYILGWGMQTKIYIYIYVEGGIESESGVPFDREGIAGSLRRAI